MGENSKIEWTDNTFNPWEGCTKVSPACANCYAEARNHRYGLDNWGKGKPRRRTSAANWKKPVRWNKERAIWMRGFGMDEPAAVAYFPRPRVFCASLADWLDDEVPIEWLADLLKLIHDTPNLDWLLLSKRLENWRGRTATALSEAAGSKDANRFPIGFIQWLQAWLGCTPTGEHKAPHNVWMGTTVESPDQQDRVNHLLQIPAKVRFLSCEPLLGNLELSDVTKRSDSIRQLGKKAMDGIHWVICGCESGPNRRSMKTEWAMSLQDQCVSAGVPFFMKQMEVNGKVTGELNLYPKELQRREFPVCQ